MERTDRGPYILVVVFALLVLAGFYFMFDRISGLDADVKNLELQTQLAQKTEPTTPSSPTPSPTTTSPTPAPTEGPTGNNSSEEVSIPTAIVLAASSSPSLQPQAPLTITVDSVSQATDGTITLNFKVYTSDATSYSAFDASSTFQIVNLNGDNFMATNITGQFSSMAPGSSVGGNVQFLVPGNPNPIILQVQTGQDFKFYEIDFVKQTYKETVIG